MRDKPPSRLATTVVVVGWFVALAWLGSRQGWWRARTQIPLWAGPDQQCLMLRWASSRVGWVRSDRRSRPDGGLEVTTEARLAIAAFGAARELSVVGEYTVDAAQSLERFSLDVRADNVPYSIRGERQGSEFVIRQGADPLWSQRRIDASVAAHMGVGDPLLGTGTVLPPRGGTLTFLNPLTLEVEEVEVRSLGTDTVGVGRTTVAAQLLEVESFGLRSHCWVDAEGRLIRARTPIGIEAVSVPCTEAQSAALRPVEPMRVVTEGQEVPEESTRLVLSMGIPPELRVENHRQAWIGDTLVTRAERPPGQGGGEADSTYFQPGPLIESDNPMLARRAREVVGEERDPWDKALLLLAWVDAYLSKGVCLGVPSALSALQSGTGDCNEHAALFVALCRAVGVPADLRAGVAYVPGYGFGYHAWAAVHVGRWIETDPTWGQTLVDASHVSLVEGTPEEHVDLALAGELLTIRVLEAEASGS